MSKTNKILIGENRLTIDALVEIARGGKKIELDETALKKITRCRSFLDKKLQLGTEIYGVNTGLGGTSHLHISEDVITEMQNWQIRSHAAGIGEPMKIDQVRAAMVSRISTHAQGYSACRPEVTQTLVGMLNQGVTPMVPARGSVGASGDLAPMSHVGLVLIGEGEAHYQGKVMAGKEAMLAAGIKPLRLQVRDALALINGSNFICGIGSLLIADAEQWIKQAEITAAMSFEGLRAKTEALDERIHKIRGFAGAITSAKNLRSIIAGSSLAQQQSQNVQDAYSIRSTPQVIGTVRDALKYIRQQCETELNGAGDNPLFIAEDEVILTGANFQGTPIGLPLDLLGAAITMVSVLSERRLNRLVHPYLNEGLPMFLTKKPGMFSGFMTSQYTADSLVTEQRLLSSPASTLSIPASADQEDFVSMGLHAAHKCWQIIENAYGVLGIELMAAAQAINLRDWKIGRGTAAAHEAVRQVVAPLEEDRTLYLDHQKMVQLLRSGEVLNAVEKSIGKLTD